ncbi:MAG: hypothetical protein V1863_04955 [Candidatus Omnitrophota bacterium]
MKVPHSPSEISGHDGFAVLEGTSRVVSRDGADVTSYFVPPSQNTPPRIVAGMNAKRGLRRDVTIGQAR